MTTLISISIVAISVAAYIGIKKLYQYKEESIHQSQLAMLYKSKYQLLQEYYDREVSDIGNSAERVLKEMQQRRLDKETSK